MIKLILKQRDLNILLLFIFLTTITISGCYKPETFSMPGTPDDYVPPSYGIDTTPLPFPFDSTRTAGKWLIRDGNVIPGMITKKGITEFYSTNDRFAWEDKPGFGVVGRQYYDSYNDGQYGLEEILPSNSYRQSYLFSNVMVPVGKGTSYYAYCRMTAGSVTNTAMAVLGGFSWVLNGSPANGNLRIGLGGSDHFFFDLYAKAVSVPVELGTPDQIIPGQPFELEWAIVDYLLYFKIAGKEIFRFQIPEGPKYFIAPFIRPWRSFVTVHDFYVEGSEYYTPNYAMIREYEKAPDGNYGIIQNASLAKTSGNLLLFSEGRVYPTNAELASSNEQYGFTRTNQNSGPAGNSDIIMKKSSDGGATWSQDPIIIAGANDPGTFQDPQTISLDNGTVILQYIKTAGAPAARTTWTLDNAAQKIFQQKTTDGGNTWTSPKDITGSYKINSNEYVRTASGHGIELKLSGSYKGRLIMPLTFGEDSVKVSFSDDGGETWILGNKASGVDHLILPTIVEYNADTLMMISSRSLIGVTSTARSKFVSFSTDGGRNWSTPLDIKNSVGKQIDTYYAYNFRGSSIRRTNGDIVYANAINGEKDEAEASNGEPDRGTEPHASGGYTYPVEPKFWTMRRGNFNFDPEAKNIFEPLVPEVSNSGMATAYAFKTFRPPLNHIDMIELNGEVIVAGSGGLESDREGIVIYHLKD